MEQDGQKVPKRGSRPDLSRINAIKPKQVLYLEEACPEDNLAAQDWFSDQAEHLQQEAAYHYFEAKESRAGRQCIWLGRASCNPEPPSLRSLLLAVQRRVEIINRRQPASLSHDRGEPPKNRDTQRAHEARRGLHLSRKPAPTQAFGIPAKTWLMLKQSMRSSRRSAASYALRASPFQRNSRMRLRIILAPASVGARNSSLSTSTGADVGADTERSRRHGERRTRGCSRSLPEHAFHEARLHGKR
jgi:hypothetical protein